MKTFKKILLSLCALFLVLGTYFVENRLDKAKASAGDFGFAVIEKAADGIFVADTDGYRANSGSGKMTIQVGDNVVLRFDSSSAARLSIENRTKTLNIRLSNGRLWMNTLNSAIPAEIRTAEILVAAEPGVFDVEYANSSLTLSALRRSLTVEFSGKKLVLPENRQTVISETKIRNAREALSKLRYSKLTKEFPYFSADKKDRWLTANLAEDEKFNDQYKSSVISRIRAKGAVLPMNDNSVNFKLEQLVSKGYIELTFDAAKKRERETSVALDYFDAGVYANSVGKNDIAKKRFDEFSSLAARLSADFGNAAWRDVLFSRISDSVYIQPEDPMFIAKTTLRSSMRQSVLADLHASFNDILDVYAASFDAQSQQRILAMLRRFGMQAEALKNINDINLGADILFEDILFNDFLNRSPKFLKEEFLKVSETFELSYLNLLANREEQEDQRQFLISEKLRRIKAINSFLTSGNIAFQDARNSILLLVRQIEGLKPTFPTTAVLTYFDDQLEQLGDLLSFLRSSSADNVHGSFQENFAEFQSSMDEMRTINDMLSQATGGIAISPFRREELASIVANDLAVVNVVGARIVLPDEEGDSRVRISSAAFEGKSFSAVYDTARKVFSNIVFDNENITSAIRLENLKRFLLVKLGRVNLPTGVNVESLTEAPSQQSLLERVAKTTVMDELQRNNISVEERYLGFENLSDGIVHVRLAHIGQDANTKVFSFDLLQRSNRFENLKVQTVSGEIPVNGSFALRELATKVEQIYQRALFEKQREEELARFARGETAGGGTSVPQ